MLNGDDLQALRPLEEFGKIGRYELLQELGQGGMGKVYKASDPRLQRIVALKVLKHAECEDDCKQLIKEARTAAQLRDPHIVSIYEIDCALGVYYIVMEYVPGCSLAEYIKEEIPDCDWSLHKLRLAALAIHHAHRQGVLHRDLKPANIMLLNKKTPKITDFGLAKMLDADSTVSSSGTIIGTPAYMSPEQVNGDRRKIDQRTDVYGLGAVLYEMFTGKPPFQGESIMEIATEILQNPPPAPANLNPSLSREAEAICLKCLEKQPKNRYQSAYALVQDIERYQEQRPITVYRSAFTYRFVKWICRNLSLGKIAMIFLALAFIVSIIFNVYLYRRFDPDKRDIPSRKNVAVKPGVRKNLAFEQNSLHVNEKSTSLPAGFIKTIESMTAGDTDYRNIEKRFIEMQHRMIPGSDLHRLWGESLLARAIREKNMEKRMELFAKACEQFDYALAVDPQDDRSYFLAYQIAKKLRYVELWKSRYKNYKSKLRKRNNKYILYVKAEALLESSVEKGQARGFLENALEACERSLQFDCEFAEAYALKARIYMKLERYEQAKESCQKALEGANKNYFFRADFLVISGDIHRARKEMEKAIADYDLALDEDSREYEAYTGKAFCHMKENKYRLACTGFSLAIESGGNPLECYRLRCESRLEMKKYELALQDARYLQRIDRKDGFPYVLAAKIYQRQRDYRRALKEVERGLKIAPKNRKLRNLYTLFYAYVHHNLNIEKK